MNKAAIISVSFLATFSVFSNTYAGICAELTNKTPNMMRCAMFNSYVLQRTSHTVKPGETLLYHSHENDTFQIDHDGKPSISIDCYHPLSPDSDQSKPGEESYRTYILTNSAMKAPKGKVIVYSADATVSSRNSQFIHLGDIKRGATIPTSSCKSGHVIMK